MSSPIKTTNSLKDIVDWLATGSIVCLHANRTYQYYVSSGFTNIVPETTRLIYVNVSSNPSLMSEDEWPYYIHGANNISYTSRTLPTDPDLIHYFEVPALR